MDHRHGQGWREARARAQLCAWGFFFSLLELFFRNENPDPGIELSASYELSSMHPPTVK
jgi:hypothetical protein